LGIENGRSSVKFIKDAENYTYSDRYMEIEKQQIKCPECGSTNTWKTGFVVRRKGKYQRHQCKNCGYEFAIEFYPFQSVT
jgi:transposase-like protein